MPVLVRPAVPRDLPSVQAVEEAADRLLTELLHPDRWEPAPTGAERAAGPGYLLVAEEVLSAGVVGFVHVLEVEDVAHLEQVSVTPEHGRQRIGHRLIEAAAEEARHRGHTRLTLRTFADVPFNAPFYASLGFVETEPETDFHRALVGAEHLVGLDRYGRRIQMTLAL